MTPRIVPKMMEMVAWRVAMDALLSRGFLSLSSSPSTARSWGRWCCKREEPDAWLMSWSSAGQRRSDWGR